MHCKSCKRLIESVCRDIPGVRTVSLDENTGDGSLEHDGTATFELLAKEIESLGDYRVNLL